jgi:predicted HicB family RNase H-like nuclease
MAKYEAIAALGGKVNRLVKVPTAHGREDLEELAKIWERSRPRAKLNLQRGVLEFPNQCLPDVPLSGAMQVRLRQELGKARNPKRQRQQRTFSLNWWVERSFSKDPLAKA